MRRRPWPTGGLLGHEKKKIKILHLFGNSKNKIPYKQTNKQTNPF